MDAGVQQGPLINQAVVDKVDAHVKDAVAHGVTILAGDKLHALSGTFYEPTIISGATNEMRLAHEETFGPVAALIRFKTDEEAITAANASEFGLASYFYTRGLVRTYISADRAPAALSRLPRLRRGDAGPDHSGTLALWPLHRRDSPAPVSTRMDPTVQTRRAYKAEAGG